LSHLEKKVGIIKTDREHQIPSCKKVYTSVQVTFWIEICASGLWRERWLHLQFSLFKDFYKSVRKLCSPALASIRHLIASSASSAVVVLICLTL